MKDKIKAAQRVIYSINLFVYTYIYLKKNCNKVVLDNIDNCHLESFLTHARNLDCFFSEKGQEDDIYISDFTTVQFPTTLDQNVVKKINKSLAHLTYHNIDYKPEWKMDLIAGILLPNCLQFLEDKFFDENTIDAQYSEIRKGLVSLLRNILNN